MSFRLGRGAFLQWARWITAPLALGACASTHEPVDAGSAVDGGADAAEVDAAAVDGPAGDVDAAGLACRHMDPFAARRDGCAFAAGARPEDTLGDLTMARTAIQHVIVIVHENHSLDNMFGLTGHGIDGLPAGAGNPDGNGGAVAPYHLTELCSADPPHDFDSMHAEYDDGKMDGFYLVGGPVTMGYYDDADHPFYTWAATTFATADRYFASVLGPTWPNRDYLFAGTSDGIRATGERALTKTNITDLLDQAGVPWVDYNNGSDPALQTDLGWGEDNPPQIRPYDELAGALDSGNLPPVVFIDDGDGTFDEHPGDDGIDHGERKVADLVAKAFASPAWPHLAILFTYDENGGFYDHVPPPPACLAAPSETAFDRLGFRVPFILISPYARPGFVSHEVHSHTSILRLIEALFGLPALTGRDANSDALLDMFDFCAASFPAPPETFPAANATVSTCP